MVTNPGVLVYEALNTDWPFVIAGGLGLAAVFVAAAHLAWTAAEAKVKAVLRSFKKKTKRRSHLNPRLEAILGLTRQESKLEQLLKKAAVELPGAAMLTAKVVLSAAVLSVFGFLVGAIWLKNIPAAVVLVFFSFLAAVQVFGKKAVKTQRDYLKELAAAVRIFAALFESTGNLQAAIKETAARSPKPIDKVFDMVYSKLKNGATIEEAAKVIPKEIKLGHAKLFALHLSEADREGTAFLPQFARLASQIDSVHESYLENAVLLAPGRFTNVVLHLGIVVLVLLVSYFVPNARHYLTDEAAGRFIVLCAFMSPVLSMVIDIMWSRVEEG